jgi:hypothetical protein
LIARVLPHHEEAEKVLLGVILSDNSKLEKIKSLVAAEDFYKEANSTIFKTMIQMAEAQKPIDLITLGAELETTLELTGVGGVGGAYYLSSLMDGVPRSSNVEYYSKMVKDAAVRRRFILEAHKLTQSAYEGEDAGKLLNNAMATIESEKESLSPVSNRTIAQEVEDWVKESSGIFTLRDISGELRIFDKKDKHNLSTCLGRLCKSGLIVREGKKHGAFRRVEIECEEIDWINAPTKGFDISLPFGLENLCTIYPKNLIAIAGNPDAGKTTFCLNVAKMNLGKNDIYYFTSEMGESELQNRLRNFEDMKDEDWKKVKIFERSCKFEDVIRPNAINIIDYLEANDEFYKIVGDSFRRIYEKLNLGIAIICIQKDPGKSLGRGASFGMEKPRLYLTMGGGYAKIIKAKNWAGNENPNGKIMTYTIEGGWKFICGEWRRPDRQLPMNDTPGMIKI